MEFGEAPPDRSGERDPEEYEKRIRALEAEVERLKREAKTDPLTGTYNRRGLRELAPEGREQGRRKETAVLMVDIDNFKVVNDLYKHEAGDAVLKAVAEFLRAHTRARDVVARWGGEEFVIAFNGADAQSIIDKFYEPEDPAEPKKERRAKINVPVSIPGEEKPVSITLSGGVATQRENEAIEDAVARADKALYRAKESGKDRIESAEDETS